MTFGALGSPSADGVRLVSSRRPTNPIVNKYVILFPRLPRRCRARQWRGIGWWGCKPDLTKDGQAYRNPKDKRIAERIARGEQARLYDWWEVNQVKNVGEQKTEHPCQIPEEIMRRILTVTDCKLVVDPFCGSGTTLVAAKRLGIRAIGIERNKNYCELAARRCSQEMTLVPPNDPSSADPAHERVDCNPVKGRGPTELYARDGPPPFAAAHG